MSRSRLAALILALLTAGSVWLSAGTIAVLSGDTHRIAALPSIWILITLVVAAVVAARMAKLRLDEAWPLLITLLLWLPFLPGPVPSAFLIWQGPAEGLVWLIAIAGVLASRPPKLLPIVFNPDRAPWLVGAIVALGALAVFGGVRGVIPGGDEPHYLAATQSVLKDFDLRVANNYASGDYLDYFPGRLEPHFLKRSTSGEIYSIHAPGVSVVVLPAFAIAGYVGAVLTMILIAAVTAAITWRLAWRISGSVAGAWVGVAAVFATSPYFFHTFTIYPEVIGSLCVACGVWLLLELEDLSPEASAKGDGREVSSRLLIGVGATLAVLPWLHSRFAVLAAILGLLIALRLMARPARMVAFLAVPLIAAFAWFLFFYLIWGSPSPTAPYGIDTSTSASYIPRGLIGLLFDQQFGVITTAPIYLIALVGTVALFRTRPRLTIELLLIVVPYTMTVASYAMWWAGSAAPARFLVSVLPIAALPIAMIFSGKRREAVVSMTILFLIVSIALIMPRAFVESGRFIYNNRGGVDATLQWLTPSVDLPLALPSVHRDGGSIAVRDATVWLVLLGGAALLSGIARRAPAVKWALASGLLAISTMAAAGIVWRLHADTSPIAVVERSKLAALGSFRPSWHSVLLDVTERRAISAPDFLGALSFPVVTRRINRLPAGEYQITPEFKPPAVPVSATLAVGRNDTPFESLAVTGSVINLRLPVSLQTLNVSIDGEVPEDGPAISITPLSVRPPAASRFAIRAARYGHARAFFFDDWAYPEKDGFWTRAGGLATVVLDTDDSTRFSGLPVSITAGAVPTTITLTAGSWEQTFTFTAGQRQDVTLPPTTDGTWVLSIRSGPGFRPSEREPGSSDVRSLAAWIAIQ